MKYCHPQPWKFDMILSVLLLYILYCVSGSGELYYQAKVIVSLVWTSGLLHIFLNTKMTYGTFLIGQGCNNLLKFSRQENKYLSYF